MAIITQATLQELQARLGPNPLPDDRLLGLAYLEQEFKLPPEATLVQTAAEDNDYGISAFHVDTQLKNLYLFQFQWSEARTCFQSPFQCLTEIGMDSIFGADPPGFVPDQFLMQIRSRLLDSQDAVERVFVHLVFRGDPAKAERGAVYEKLREELENKKYLADRFFGRPVTLVFEFRSVTEGRIGALAHQRLTHSYPLALQRRLEMDGPGGERMLVGFASLSDLHAIYKQMKQRFFESNIRSMLSDQTPTNRSLTKAFESIVLERQIDPLAYAFDHNGVTLFAEKVEDKPASLTLTEPRLLNGAQTLSTLDRFLEAHQDDPRLAAGQAALKEMSVLCKIITGARSDFVLRVTLSNNRQNPIKPWNLHANDLIQLELQDKFDDELGLYYERQERAFANLEEDEERGEEAAPKDEKAVELLRLARTFLLSDGDLERHARLQQIFEEEADYARCFHSGRLAADSRDILLCYKVQFRLGRVLREIIERGEKKYAYFKRARNLTWALLCQAILNDPELPKQREAFGKSLGVEPGYAKWLEGLAGSRVRPMVAAAVEEAAYAGKLAAEKLGFLNTQAFYKACLRQGHARWDWKAKSLGRPPVR
jgi:hypothetical protein